MENKNITTPTQPSVDFLQEINDREKLIAERTSELSEQSLLAFRQLNSRAIEKIVSLREIHDEWALINSAASDFSASKNKETAKHMFGLLVLWFVFRYFLDGSFNEIALLTLLFFIHIGYFFLKQQAQEDKVYLKKAILDVAINNLRSEIKSSGISDSTLRTYLQSMKEVESSEYSAEPFKMFHKQSLKFSQSNIRLEILDLIEGKYL